jgi:large subunit ribosomal protein L35
MPKMKKHSAAKKRFKRTATGKVKRGQAYKRHLMASKTAKRKRHLRHASFISAADMRHFRALLPG